MKIRHHTAKAMTPETPPHPHKRLLIQMAIYLILPLMLSTAITNTGCSDGPLPLESKGPQATKNREHLGSSLANVANDALSSRPFLKMQSQNAEQNIYRLGNAVTATVSNGLVVFFVKHKTQKDYRPAIRKVADAISELSEPHAREADRARLIDAFCGSGYTGAILTNGIELHRSSYFRKIIPVGDGLTTFEEETTIKCSVSEPLGKKSPHRTR